MRNQTRLAILIAATAFAVAACSGSGGGGNQGPPPNTAPTIGALNDVAINQDTSTTALAVNVTDAQSESASLKVSVTASDDALLPAQGIVLSGSDSRSLTLTPAESAVGTTMVTITATDPRGLSATHAFNFTVNAVNASFTQFTTDTFAVAADELSRSFVGFTLDGDANDNDAVFEVLLQ